MNRIPGYNTISKGRWSIGEDLPRYAVEAEGCHVTCDDGKEYIDWTASLGTIIRGYDKQLYPTGHHCLPMETLAEHALAEELCQLYDMDMCRFFKNGSDACTAAVELSKQVTNRKIVFSSGYHGWHSWTREMVCKVDYWNVPLSTASFIAPACHILEPMDRRNPSKCCRDNLNKAITARDDKTIVIFDEVLSGFRFSLTGITGLYSVQPDLIILGKAMSNGWPISAVLGKKDIMEHFPKVGATGTYWSDDLSCRAALENIKLLKRMDYEAFNNRGEAFAKSLESLITAVGVRGYVSVKYFGSWCAFEWKEPRYEQFFIPEIMQQGILFNRDHFLTFAHTNEDIERTLAAYSKAFRLMKGVL